MDWKTTKKIDAHIHLIPDEVHKANPDSDDEFSYAVEDEHIKIMDKYNIEKSIIMTFNDVFLMSMDFSLDAVHKNIIEICKKYPGRYYAFTDIDPRLSAIKNCNYIRKLFPNKWFKGIKIHPNNSGINIDDEYNDPIFELAKELNIPIAIHSYPSGHMSKDKGDYCSPTRISNIISRHADVKVIICHMGGFQWEDCLNIDAFFDISAILPDYVKELGIENTKFILNSFDINRLLFASDFPCSRSLDSNEIYERYFEILNKLDFSDNDIDKIAYINIKNLLKL